MITHLKILTLIVSVMAAAIIALDPTVQVAIVMAIPTTILGIGTLVLGFMNRNKLNKIDVNVDGKLSQLMETQQKLSHAEGRAEGKDEGIDMGVSKTLDAINKQKP